LDEVVEGVPVALVLDPEDQLALAILHGENGQGVSDDLLARALVQIALVELVREVHVGVPLIGEHPGAALALEHDGEMVAILELERGEYPVSVEALRGEAELVADLLAKISLDSLRSHGVSPSRSES